MEDCSLRLICDWRLANCPHFGGSRTRCSRRADPFAMLRAGSQGRRYLSLRNGALALRDVKNEGRSGYVYENTGNDDKMSSYKTGFCTKMHPLREDQQESVGLMGRKCIGYAIIRDEVGYKIGSSDHRPIGPSEEHGVGFRWPDDPMVRWPDHPGSP